MSELNVKPEKIMTCKHHGELKPLHIRYYRQSIYPDKWYLRCRLCDAAWDKKRDRGKVKRELTNEALKRIQTSNPTLQPVLKRIVGLVVDSELMLKQQEEIENVK
jgi:hypothetical protein